MPPPEMPLVARCWDARGDAHPQVGGLSDFENEFSPLLQKLGSKPFLAFTDGLLLGQLGQHGTRREINPKRM